MVRKRRNDASPRPKHYKEYQDDGITPYDSQNEVTTEAPRLVEHSHACLFTCGVLMAIYTATLHPSVPGGDSGELIIAAHELGVAHPPGYPVFTILAKMAMSVLPFKTIAWRVNLLNAVLSATAGGFLQLTVLKITCDTGASLFAVGLFCLSKLTWTYSVTAEVFALNNLMVAVIMYMAVRFEMAARSTDQDDTDKKSVVRTAYLGAFLSAFALCNQHTVVVYVATIAPWVILEMFRLKCLGIKQVLGLVLCAALGLTPYIYLPISSYVNTARWTWGDQTTLSGFFTHLLRSEYGTFDLGKEHEGQGFITGVTAYFEHSHRDLCSIGPFLAVIGSLSSVTHYRGKLGEGCLFVFITMFSAYVTFFAWRANLDVSDSLLRGVVERFWMQSDMVMAVLAAVGMHRVIKVVTPVISLGDEEGLSCGFTCVAALSVLGLQLQNFQVCNQSDNYVVHDFAKTMLNSLPSNAIVLTRGDLPTNSLRYFYLCENVRPDVTLLDVEVLSYEWSLPKLEEFYEQIAFPGDKWHTTVAMWSDGKRSFNMKMLLDANYHKAEIFACIGMTDRDTSWQEGYKLWPYGPCHKVVKHSETLNVKEWTQRTKLYAAEWKFPYDVYDSKSWEKVANDEMWAAKINTAYFMYSESQNTQDGQAKADMLVASHEMYMEALKSNQVKGKLNFKENSFPQYWHKNFALVSERLLYVETKLSKANLCKTSIYHFEQYIASNPTDDDVSKIRDAVTNLRNRMETYQKLDAIENTFGKRV